MDVSSKGGVTMSLDLILIVGAVAAGVSYFAIRSSRKQRQLGEQARRAVK